MDTKELKRQKNSAKLGIISNNFNSKLEILQVISINSQWFFSFYYILSKQVGRVSYYWNKQMEC